MMRRVIRHGLAMALLTGCATHAAPPSTRVAAAVAGNDGLELHFRAVASSLRAEGLRPRGLRERGFLPPSGRIAFPVRIAAGECAMFVALATASMADLDASLYTAEGTAMVEDDSTGSRPSLTFCAGTEQPVDAYFTLHAYQGAGAFMAGQFTRSLRADDDLRTAHEQGVSALGELAQVLHDRGFEDAAPRVSVPLGDARPVRIALQVAAGECYTLAAEGGEGVTELGLRLVDAEGGELALGMGENRPGRAQLAALQYCSNQRAELALEVVARRGHGLAKVARFRATQARVGGARALWLGEPAPSAQAWAVHKPSTTEKVAGQRSDKSTKAALEMHAEMAKASERALAAKSGGERVPLRQGQLVDLAPRAPLGRCETWQIELAPGLSRATLRVEDAHGVLLGEADSQRMHACVSVCGEPVPRRASVIGRAGFGAVTLHVEPAAQPGCDPCAEAPSSCPASSGRR